MTPGLSRHVREKERSRRCRERRIHGSRILCARPPDHASRRVPAVRPVSARRARGSHGCPASARPAGAADRADTARPLDASIDRWWPPSRARRRSTRTSPHPPRLSSYRAAESDTARSAAGADRGAQRFRRGSAPRRAPAAWSWPRGAIRTRRARRREAIIEREEVSRAAAPRAAGERSGRGGGGRWWRRRPTGLLAPGDMISP